MRSWRKYQSTKPSGWQCNLKTLLQWAKYKSFRGGTECFDIFMGPYFTVFGDYAEMFFSMTWFYEFEVIENSLFRFLKSMMITEYRPSSENHDFPFCRSYFDRQKWSEESGSPNRFQAIKVKTLKIIEGRKLPKNTVIFAVDIAD